MPLAKAMAVKPLLNLKRFRISFPPYSTLYGENKKSYRFCFLWATHAFKSFNSLKIWAYELWRVGSISPLFTASITLHPFSFVWVQEENLQL